MKKILLPVSFWTTVSLLAFALHHDYDPRVWLDITISVAFCFGSVFIAYLPFGIWYYLAEHGKVKTRKWMFKEYKAKLTKIAKKLGPLVQYPFLIFIELSLEDIFLKEGYLAATDAVLKWLKEYPEKVANALIGKVEEKSVAIEPDQKYEIKPSLNDNVWIAMLGGKEVDRGTTIEQLTLKLKEQNVGKNIQISTLFPEEINH